MPFSQYPPNNDSAAVTIAPNEAVASRDDPPVTTPTGKKGAPATTTNTKPSKRSKRGKAETSANEWTKPSDKLNHRPFEKISRGEQWAVHEQGKFWISQRLPSFMNMDHPPGGLPYDEATNRQLTHRQWWTRELGKAYMENWPDFELQEVLGVNYTPAQKALHDEVVRATLEAERTSHRASSGEIQRYISK
ncbi:hypothetical protein M422DRAFT_258433 [Sphaerobolus stellatus SS14]|uniref:Uncharacterized protein n=1 Tax=Sphaerobolus stellatus (strain SS14) TaxID=990650 RepID=A0A0C9VLT4_SPHS4|nr:hypothetical protein M422DRAFT_258433 [Sphaerobolus stellatus SS14]